MSGRITFFGEKLGELELILIARKLLREDKPLILSSNKTGGVDILDKNVKEEG